MFLYYIFLIILYFPCFAEQFQILLPTFSYKKTPEMTWIFSPGIHSEGLELLSKYVVGGRVECGTCYAETDRSLEVIDPYCVSYTRYAEIDILKPRYLNPFSYLYNKIIASVYRLTNKLRDVKHNLRFSINISNINFGQWLDIACLQKTFLQHKERFGNSNIMLYGTSRGAACLFNACALGEIPLDQVKGVILEGCFDDVQQVMLKGKLPVNAMLAQVVQRCFNVIYHGYDIQGPKPIGLVEQYPKDIPTLFVTSHRDMLVPMHLTLNLFRALKSLGYKNVYLLILKHSPHREYIYHTEDRDMYRKAVHAFYKLCGMPYDVELAQEGSGLLMAESPVAIPTLIDNELLIKAY